MIQIKNNNFIITGWLKAREGCEEEGGGFIKIITFTPMQNHHHYNKNLREFAHEKRNEMTKAEACLWKYALRGKQMGYTFNRQRPVLNYIADFMCKACLPKLM